MVRKGALTLGAVLMLGASGARAQDLSAFGIAAPSLTGVLPNLPQNWSDLPIQFKISEAVGYNSNVVNTPSSGIGVNRCWATKSVRSSRYPTIKRRRNGT